MPGTITASLPDASAEPCTLVPLYENSTRTGNEFEFLKRATRELPRLSYETVTPPILFCPVTTATCNTNIKTETKTTYRPVLSRMVMALSTTTDCPCQYRNRPCMGNRTRSAFHLHAQVGRVAIIRLHQTIAARVGRSLTRRRQQCPADCSPLLSGQLFRKQQRDASAEHCTRAAGQVRTAAEGFRVL